MLSIHQINQQEQFDVVVLLHPGSWHNELTSNRWHYIRFFDQFVDVIIVQPTSNAGIQGLLEPDKRFTRTNIFHTATIRPVVDSPTKGARVILNKLDELGYRRPLYWLSTPLYWNVACHLHNGPIVFHATEDYPRLSIYNEHPASSFIRQCAVKAAEHALVTLSVSDGVTKSLEEIVEIGNLIQSTNGYAFSDYGPDSLVENIDLVNTVNSIVYCGNINKRIDFPLLEKIATYFQDRSLILVGPVHIEGAIELSWHSLLRRSNVFYIKHCTIPQMNWLYRNSTTGIIPYLHDSIIVESGFPLKALEMVAAGLPVTTTQMKALEGINPFIRVTKNHREFLQAVETHTRLNCQLDEAESLASIEKFRYEIQIPRVWSKILYLSELVREDRGKRQMARFSLFSAVSNTLRLLKTKGLMSIVEIFKRSLFPSS